MDVRYEQFCLADPVFYDTPSRWRMADRRFSTMRPVPSGWRSYPKDDWTVFVPIDAVLPPQGWKVHVSTTPDNAVATLDKVWNYCVPRNIAFKFLSDPAVLLLRNAKYADRGSSGKFVTIYPTSLTELERILAELGAELEGWPGPYILSDVRWGAGPLYLRYGGFAERLCKLPDGGMVPAISDPQGHLVPDWREPSFKPPSWVAVPGFLAPAVAARRSPATPHDFPFEVERSLHFSNGGGIYLATEVGTGRRVVLREARPFAGLDQTGHDAVRRLEREREFLEKLAGIGIAPEIYGHFTCWEHHFLVEEYIEVPTLGRAFVERYPLIRSRTTGKQIAGYTRWALDKLEKVEQALRTLHDLGVVFGDLHPHNIVVRPGGHIRFVDFEVASFLTADASPVHGAAGYVPPDDRTGIDVDLYAMAALRLAMFLPLTALLPSDPEKLQALARFVQRRFPVPKSFVTEAVEVLRDRRPAPGAAAAGTRHVGGTGRRRPADAIAGDGTRALDWPRLRISICSAILASATPERTDRLFPGDIGQFIDGGLGVAYGAAGVLYALARSGAGRYQKHEQWLLDAVHKGHHDGRVGFYDGLHGIAYVLAELGRREDAWAVLDRAMATPLDDLSPTLFAGLSGAGLNLLHFAAATGDRSLHGQAIDIGARLAGRLHIGRDAEAARGPSSGRPRAGLMHGPSGQALLFVRLFEATGDGQFLDLAETALQQDIDRCVSTPSGSMQVDEGWRSMPYLATGSVGLGLVLQEFLRHRAHDGFAQALTRIHRAAEPEFVIGSGLFNGRAGFIAFLAWRRAVEPQRLPVIQRRIDRHLNRLAWHILRFRGNVAFPGDQLMRLSMDLATGSAGVLFALSAALDEDGPSLPFLGVAGPRAERR